MLPGASTSGVVVAEGGDAPVGLWEWINSNAGGLGVAATLVVAVLGGLLTYWLYYRGGFRPAVRAQITADRLRMKVRVFNRGRTEGSVSELRVVVGDELRELLVAPFEGAYEPQRLGPHEDMILIVDRKDGEAFEREACVSIRFGKDRKLTRCTPRTKGNAGFNRDQARLPGN